MRSQLLSSLALHIALGMSAPSTAAEDTAKQISNQVGDAIKDAQSHSSPACPSEENQLSLNDAVYCCKGSATGEVKNGSVSVPENCRKIEAASSQTASLTSTLADTSPTASISSTASSTGAGIVVSTGRPSSIGSAAATSTGNGAKSGAQRVLASGIVLLTSLVGLCLLI